MEKKLPIICLLLFYTFHLHAEFVKIIDDEQQALQMRIDLIRKAKHEILLSYYIFEDDKIGHLFVSELAKASRRGVKVCLYVDNTNNHLATKFIDYLVYNGVLVREYNPFHLYTVNKFIRYRLHDKIFLTDKKHLILGGRNIENKYFGLGKKNFHDRDVYIEGKETPEHVREYYLYSFFAAPAKARFSTPDVTLDWYKKIDEIEIYLQSVEEEFALTDQTDVWRKDVVEVGKIAFAHDKIELKDKTIDDTSVKLLEVIRETQDTLLIDSPYLVLTSELTKELSNAVKRGVYVRILTNSLYATDGILPQAAYLNDRKQIIRMGIDLYEYYAEECFHSKSFVADDVAMIGSMNLDERSFYLNKETYALFYDEAFAEKLKYSMNETMQYAVKINKKGLPESIPNRVKPIKFIFTQLVKSTIAERLRYLI